MRLLRSMLCAALLLATAGVVMPPAATALVSEPSAPSLAGGTFVGVAPARLLDTRVGNGAAVGAVSAGHTVQLQVTGRGGVPAGGVSAVVLNLTATGAMGSGYVTAYAGGAVKPASSSVNFRPGQSVANLVVAPVGANGKVALTVTGAGTQLIADTTAYLRASTDGWGGFTRVEDAAQHLTGVSCVSTSFCVAVDDSGQALTLDGHGWGSPITVDSSVSFTSISCTSVSFCAAVGFGGIAATYDGVKWTNRTLTDPNELVGVSCVSSSFCLAMDVFGSALAFNGASWSAPVDVMHASPPGASVTASVSCASTTFCVVDNTAGWIWTYNGSWSGPVSVIQGTESGSISCPSVSFCQMGGGGGAMATYNGSDWTFRLDTPRFPSHELIGGLDCLGPDFCAGVNNSSFYVASVFDGQEWNPADLYLTMPADTVNDDAAVSCASTSFCVSVVGPYARIWF